MVVSPPGGYAVEFRRVERADFPLLARWLATEPVRRWWCHEWSAEAVERDFGPRADGLEPNEDWLALLDGEPVGLVQRSRVADYATTLPDAPAILVAVVAANPASWQALEKAGFRRVASGDLPPHNPVDDPLHHLYRVDRPA